MNPYSVYFRGSFVIFYSMKVFDIAIIGGGAAGLFAAAQLAKLNSENNTALNVVVLEKMERCGRKIAITGKGRCNITNMKPWEEFLHYIHPKSSFFKNAFYWMSNVSTIDFFNSIGLTTVIERGDRAFPESMKAMDVTDALVRYSISNGVKIITDFCVDNINEAGGTYSILSSSGAIIETKAVIVATGGMSYPSTGSTGDGYEFAKLFGHKITHCFPSLTALKPFGYSESFWGISLKNVSVSLIVGGNVVQEEFGDLDFTNGGIEGPIGFKVSRKAVHALVNGEKVELILDMKPAISVEQLKDRVNKEIVACNSRNLNVILRKLLPVKLISVFKDCNADLQISNLPEKLKNWKFKIVGNVGYERCVVTAGGVSLAEVSQKSMESKLKDSLYFAGEVLDLDADTGGFNLQVAFSTGALAAYSAYKKIISTK